MKKVIQGGTIINEGRQFQADLVIEGGKITQILAGSGNTASGSSGNRCQPLFRYSGGNRRSGAFSGTRTDP